MTDENLAALKRLELIHEYIYNECEGKYLLSSRA